MIMQTTKVALLHKTYLVFVCVLLVKLLLGITRELQGVVFMCPYHEPTEGQTLSVFKFLLATFPIL